MMDGGFQLWDTFPGIGADDIDMFRIDTSINKKIPTPFDITFGQIGFRDHPNGGNVVSMDKIRRKGVLGVHAGADQND